MCSCQNCSNHHKGKKVNYGPVRTTVNLSMENICKVHDWPRVFSRFHRGVYSLTEPVHSPRFRKQAGRPGGWAPEEYQQSHGVTCYCQRLNKNFTRRRQHSLSRGRWNKAKHAIFSWGGCSLFGSLNAGTQRRTQYRKLCRIAWFHCDPLVM